MSYDEVIESTLKQFNLPKLKFESSFKNGVIIFLIYVDVFVIR